MLPLSGYTLTPSQITALVNQQTPYEVARRSMRFRLLDRSLRPVNLGIAGATGDYADITRYIDRRAVVTNDTTRPVCRSLDIVYYETPQIHFNSLQHYMQAFIDYWDAAGTLLLEVPVGIFYFVLPDRNLADSGNTWTLQGLDLTGKINKLTFLNTWSIPAGTLFTTAITQILTCGYVPVSQGGTGQTPAGMDCEGPAIPLSRINITPSAAVTPVPIQFQVETGILAAVNQLLDAMNYYPLWCDEVGTFRSSPIPYYTLQTPALSWTYATDVTSTIKPGSMAQRFTNTDALANTVKLICENNGAAPVTSTKYNNSPNSAISLVNYPEALPLIIHDNRMPDQASADLRCLIELQKAATLAEQVTFTTAPNPFHQTHDYLGLNITNPQGVLEIGTGAYGWHEIGWSIDMSQGGGTMTHTVGKIVGL